MRSKKQKGYGVFLLEVLIGLVCILILMSTTAVSLTRYVKSNNTNAALYILRSVSRSEGWFFRVYTNGYETPQYLANGSLGIGTVAPQNCNTPGLIGAETAAVFNTATYYGYVFTFTPGPVSTTQGTGCNQPGFATYTVTANPVSPASSDYSFFVDQTGVVRFAQGGPASAASSIW